jgi:hypothetical protein
MSTGHGHADGPHGIETIEAALRYLLAQLNQELTLPVIWTIVLLQQASHFATDTWRGQSPGDRRNSARPAPPG